MVAKEKIINDIHELYDPETWARIKENYISFTDSGNEHLGLITYRIDQDDIGDIFVITGIKGHFPGFSQAIKNKVIKAAKKQGCYVIQTYSRSPAFSKYLTRLGFKSFEQLPEEVTIYRYQING